METDSTTMEPCFAWEFPSFSIGEPVCRYVDIEKQPAGNMQMYNVTIAKGIP